MIYLKSIVDKKLDLKLKDKYRYNFQHRKTYIKCKCSSIYGYYIEKNSLKFSSEFKAVWHLNEGYFVKLIF